MIAGAAVVGLIVLLGLYVALTVGPDLAAARRALGGSPTALKRNAIVNARGHLAAADRELESLPARILGFVPVVSQNLAAIKAAAGAGVGALDAAAELAPLVEELRQEGFLQSGRVRLAALEGLRAPLERQAGALAELERVLRLHRNGWLMPPVWDATDSLLRQAAELRLSSANAADAVEIAGPMLGKDEPRTYLVMLINNAELRGAGGILSGLGTLTASNGRLDLGPFFHYGDINGDPPYQRVQAPADFVRRYSRYGADTTQIVNTTFSPDVPDVALVASRLFEASQGVATDGAIMADARTFSGLLPSGRALEVPTLEGRKLTAATLEPFLYSEAYEALGGGSAGRREAIVDVGKSAFDSVLDSGLGMRSLPAASAAAAGGHLRVVSFEPAEQAVLNKLGASGELEAPEGDSTLVTGQNFGGDKLDYWIRRSVEHGCVVEVDGSATCTTRVTLANEAPPGLPRYVAVGGPAGGPAGRSETLLEIYVPAAAHVLEVKRDGRSAKTSMRPEEGRMAVNVYVELARGDQSRVTVSYSLPPNDGNGLTMSASPQALTRDAHLELGIKVPSGWTVAGPGDPAGGSFVYDGPFDRPLRFEAQPDQRTGIPAAWSAIQRFWRDPVFS